MRLAPLSTWLNNKERFFFDKKETPLLVTVDSYYYLDIAALVQSGEYQKIDQRRHVPVGHSRSSHPPLLSVIIAKLSDWTSVSLEWIAILLPPILGILLAIPSYILAFLLMMRAKCGIIDEGKREVSARLTGLAAAFFSLLSPMYMERSAVGWLDTDVLNVTFPLCFVILGIKLADSQRVKDQVICLFGFLITMVFFLWWWDQSYIAVIGFAAIPLLSALLIIALRYPRKLTCPLAFSLLLVIVLVVWNGWDAINPVKYLSSVNDLFDYIRSDQSRSPFRPSGIAVSEQASASLQFIMTKSSGSIAAFAFAVAGLILLAWLTRAHVLFLGAIVAVSLLSLNGVRFLIFPAPLFGLGIGSLIFFVFHLIRKSRFQSLALLVIFLVASWGAVQFSKKLYNRAPRRLPVLFEAMKGLQDNTPENAVIWASWGHGHPMVYYGQRGVIADGMYHSAELQYVFNYPLAARDFRQAANWISFYTSRGPQGLRRVNKLFGKSGKDWAAGTPVVQRLLSLGVSESRKVLSGEFKFQDTKVEETLKFLFPGNLQPIYLFLDYLLVNQAWYDLGRWNVQRMQKPKPTTFIPLTNIKFTQDNKIIGVSPRRQNFIIDLKKGEIETRNKGGVPLSVLHVHDGKRLKRNRYRNNSGLVLDVFVPGRVGVVLGPDIAESLIIKLFYEYTYDPRFFDFADGNLPYYSLWKVLGEKYKP